MDKKCLEKTLDSMRHKEKEYVALAQQASGAIQILEHLILQEEDVLKNSNKDLLKANK